MIDRIDRLRQIIPLWMNIARAGFDPKVSSQGLAALQMDGRFQSTGRQLAGQLRAVAIDPTPLYAMLDISIGQAYKHPDLEERYAALNRFLLNALTDPDRPTISHELADGPISPNKFRWRGVVVDLQPRAFQLLEYVWHHPVCDIEDAATAAWDGEAGDSAIKSAISRVNQAMTSVRFPKRLSQKSGKLLIE